MKRLLISCAVVLAFTAAGGALYNAAADTGPPPDMAQPPPPPGPPGQWGGPKQGPWGGPGGPGRLWGRSNWGPGGPGSGRDDKFGLFGPVDNKDLSTADVKIIATAILLEQGNHSWGVSNIVAEQDKQIEFSFTTPHGDVIATFAIDPASGKIKRVS